MDKNIKITGKWKGYYEYGPDYKEIEGQKGYFIAQLIEKNGEFTGVVNDIEGTAIIEEEGKVSGYIEGDYINFIITYQNSYYVENDEMVVVANNPYEVQNEGTFDFESGSYKGLWEIEETIEKLSSENIIDYIEMGALDNSETHFPDDYMLQISSGTWEMWFVE